MKLIIAMLSASMLLSGCLVATIHQPRPDSTYYATMRPDCANKDAQIAYLNRQLTRPGIGHYDEQARQISEIKRLIWEVRSTCQ